MLVALTNDCQLFSLVGKGLQKQELLQLRKQQKFYCPACKNEVILKLGDKHTWHFAHKHTCNCIEGMEGETVYHIKGKRLLYEWFLKQNFQVSLETYLPDIKQRPDLLVKISGQSYVIEYQCSKIPPNLFIKRTKTYKHHQYSPIWILGGNLLKRLNANFFQLSSFHWMFVNQNDENQLPQLISFCPENKQFLVLSNIVSLSQTRSACTPIFYQIAAVSFQTLFQRDNTIPIIAWQKNKQQWRKQRLRLNQSEKFLSNIYASKAKPLWLFPSEAGIPVAFHHFIETPTYVWQSWILEMFIANKEIGNKFHINIIYRSFNTLIKKKVFHCRKLPLLSSGGELEAVKHYLLFLCQIKLLKTTDTVTFTINERLNFSVNLESALKKDSQLVKIWNDNP